MRKISAAVSVFAFALVLAGCGNNSQVKNPPSAPNAKQSNSNSSQAQTNSNGSQTESQNTATASDEKILFWGEGCPHCTNVENYFKESGADQKLGIKQIEVFQNKDGQKLFTEKAKECNLQSLGVPTLYEKGVCTQGDQPIIDKLKGEVGDKK